MKRIDCNLIETVREINIDHLPISQTLEKYLRNEEHEDFIIDEFIGGEFCRRLISIIGLDQFLGENTKLKHFKALKNLVQACKDLSIDQITID